MSGESRAHGVKAVTTGGSSAADAGCVVSPVSAVSADGSARWLRWRGFCAGQRKSYRRTNPEAVDI